MKDGHDGEQTHGALHRVEGFCRKRRWLLVAGILLIAVLLRATALLQLSETDYFKFMMPDESVYQTWAVSMVDGSYDPDSVYEISPLFAYVMAAVYGVFGTEQVYVRVLNLLIGCGTCFFLYLAVRRLTSKELPALFAALLASVYGPFILYDITLMKAPLAVFLFAVMSWLFICVMNSSSRWRTVLLGLVTGLLLSVRANAGVLIPVIPLFLAWRFFRRKAGMRKAVLILGLYCAGILLAVTPFVIRNYRVAGSFALATTQTGRNLYFGNNPDDPAPYYRAPTFSSPNPKTEGIQFAIEASRRTGTQMTSEEASAYWTSEMASYPLREPGPFCRKLGLKVMALFNSYEPGDHYDLAFMAEHAPVKVLRFPFPGFWLILPLGMAGMALLFRRSLAESGLAAMFAVYGLTLVAFYTMTRFRLPMVVILIILGTAGLHAAVTAWSGGKRKALTLLVCLFALFSIVASLPIPGRGDRTTHYNIRGVMLASKGQAEDAAWFWQESAGAGGAYSYGANLYLCGIAAGMNDAEGALAALERIPDGSAGGAPKQATRGDILVHLGRYDEAIAAYERSLEINSAQRRIRRELIRLYEEKNPTAARQHEKDLAYIDSFWPKPAD